MMIRGSILVLLSSLCLTSTALAQARRCHEEEVSDGEVLGTTDYRFDAAGRIASIEGMSNAAAYTVRTTYRYGGDGALLARRDRVFEGPIDEQVGLHAPTVVTTERRGDTVIERSDGPYEQDDGTTTWNFDERGLVSSVELPGESGDGERRYCAYDLEGRPVYMARTGEHSFERRWIWSGDRLTRVTGSAGAEEWSHDVSWRGATLVIGDAEGETTWRGSCDQLLYDVCSTVLAPVSPTGRRERLPAAHGQPAIAFSPVADLDAFPTHVLDAPLTLRALEAAYPGRSVFTSVTFGENDPDYPIPIVCVGQSASDDCGTQIHHAGRRATRATTGDPTLVASAGLRVGARYASIAPLLGDCVVVQGPENAVLCAVRADPRLTVWMSAAAGDEEERPPASMATRSVMHVDWSADP